MSLELWRDIAVVWLSLLCFIGMLIPLAAGFFAIKGLHVAVDIAPHWLGRAQSVSRRLNRQVERRSTQVVSGVVWVHRLPARWTTTLQRILGR